MSRETGNIFAMSLLPETAYGTPLTPTSAPKNYEQIAKEGYEFAEYTSTPVTNTGMSTGTAFPTKSRPGSHDVTWRFNERLSSQAVGRRLLAAFGGYSVSLLAAGVYKHTFTPLNPQSGNELPSYSYVEKIGEPSANTDIVHDIAYPGGKIDTFNFSSPSDAQNGAYLMGESGWRGSGKQLGSAATPQTGSGVNFFNSPSHAVLDDAKTENFFSATAASVDLFPSASLGGAAQVLGCDFRGLQMNHNNNLLAGQGYEGCGKFQVQADPESGSVRGSLPIGAQTTDLSLTALVNAAMAQNFNPMNRLRAQSVFSLALTWSGALISGSYYHQLKFIANKLTAKSVSVTSADSINQYAIAAETLAPGASQPYQFELTNNIPSYLTL